MMMGIYAIQGANRVYVGSALNIKRRWSDHRRELNRGTNHSRKLQFAWAKHGEAAFAFEILEIVTDPTLLLACEQRWIDALNATCPRRGMNILGVAGSQLGAKRTDASRSRMREAAIARDPSTRYRHPRGSAPWNKGQKASAETRAKISAVQRGKKRKPHSAETRQKLSAAAERRGMPVAVMALGHAASRGRKQSAAERAQRSAVHKIRCASAEFSEKMRAVAYVRWNKENDHARG